GAEGGDSVNAQLGIRASFALLGPLVGYGIDALGIAVRLVRARTPVLDGLRTPAPSADPAGHAPEPGRRTKRVTARMRRRLHQTRPGRLAMGPRRRSEQIVHTRAEMVRSAFPCASVSG